MASKSSRRKKRQKLRKRIVRSEPITAANIDDLPRPLRLLVEASDRLEERLSRAAVDPAAGVEAAWADVCKSAQQIADLSERFDALDILEAVRISQTPANPNTYLETEHEGSLAVVEVVALVLARRPTRHGTESNGASPRPRPDQHIESIAAEALRLLETWSVIPALEALANPTPFWMMSAGMVAREIHVRNLSYTHMVEDTLSALFDEASIEEDCRTAFGATVADVRSVFDAIEALHVGAWSSRLEQLAEFATLAQNEMSKSREAAATGTDYVLSSSVREHATSLLDASWSELGNAAITVETLALEAGLSIEVTENVIRTFSTEMSSAPTCSLVREFLSGRSPLRTAPLLRDPLTKDIAVVDHALHVPSIRERVEAELKAASCFDRYAKHRGEYLESEAMRLLTAQFPGCRALAGIEYYVPHPDRTDIELHPNQFSKLVEGDGLLLVDDVAIIVEDKAGALRPRSRTGEIKNLHDDLRRIVTSASDQCQRMRERILDDNGLRFRNGDWLDLAEIREIHSIAVSLDDLSGIATVTSELVAAGLIGVQHPWTVSLHDLRIVTELIERPAELLLYLRRRTEPAVTNCYHAVDELDFFLEFFASGLFVEPDPDQVALELPQFGPPTVANRRRFKAQRLELLTSRTDQLDAWYFYERKIRTLPAPKPRLNSDVELCRLIDEITLNREPGWLRTTTTLLDASSDQQSDFAKTSAKLMALTAEDGRAHTYGSIGGYKAESLFVFVWSTTTVGETLSQAEQRVAQYLAAKKHQARAAYAAAWIFNDSPTCPAVTVYDNSAPRNDPELDRLADSLQPLSGLRSNRRIPAPGSGRPKRV